jgi:hypothetical protein
MLCYCRSLAHKLFVTVILSVTYFTMCYMIVLPKLCPAVVYGGVSYAEGADQLIVRRPQSISLPLKT